MSINYTIAIDFNTIALNSTLAAQAATFTGDTYTGMSVDGVVVIEVYTQRILLCSTVPGRMDHVESVAL